MALSGALTLSLALLAGAGQDRLLLCRPSRRGRPRAGARGGDRRGGAQGRRALPRLRGRVRRRCRERTRGAARRARVRGGRERRGASGGQPVRPRARRCRDRGRADAAARSRWRQGRTPCGRCAARCVSSSGPFRRRPGPSPARIAAWTTVGAGVAAIAAGTVLAVSARSAADGRERRGRPGRIHALPSDVGGPAALERASPSLPAPPRSRRGSPGDSCSEGPIHEARPHRCRRSSRCRAARSRTVRLAPRAPTARRVSTARARRTETCAGRTARRRSSPGCPSRARRRLASATASCASRQPPATMRSSQASTRPSISTVGTRKLAMTRQGALWVADLPLREWPFEAFSRPVVASVVARDGARNESGGSAAAIEVTRLRWEREVSQAVSCAESQPLSEQTERSHRERQRKAPFAR